MKRILILIPITALLALGLVVLASNAALNTTTARATIQDAIQRATGREARIGGPLAVAWSLTPTAVVEDVTLLNPPGFSRPDLLTVRRIEARLALLPLLQGRVEIPTLAIVGPDLLLERDASGRGNWQTLPASTPSSPSAAAPKAKTPVLIRSVRLEQARLEWRGLPPLAIAILDLSPAGGPIAGAATLDGIPLTLAGTTGPNDPAGIAFDVTAAAPGLTLAATGQGTTAAIRLTAPDLAAAGALAKLTLPPLKAVILTARVAPAGLTDIHMEAGLADLGTLLPGLRLKTMAAVAGAPDQPVHATAEGQLDDLPLTLVLDTSPLIGPASAPASVIVSLDARLTADAATATIQGTFDRVTQAPELTLSARIPDLRRLGLLSHIPLPALTDATIDVRLRPGAAGGGVLARGLRITSAQGDLAGDLAFSRVPRPALRGSLVSQRLDLDAWTTLPPVTAPPAASATPVAPAPAPEPTAWLIPDRPLPLATLRRFDTDLRLAVATLQSHGALYRNLETRLLLQDGRLRLDPLTLVTPGGPLQATLQADTEATPPTAALMLRAPALDAAGLAAALGQPGALTGAANLDADLRAQGATPHAMAASLTGRLAFTMTDGDIANDRLAALFGPALRGAGIGFDPAGRSRIRCLGLRLDATAGQAALPLIALDTTRLRLEGDGQLDLAQETMDLHLRPTLRLGPTAVAVPVRLTGPFRAPKPTADRRGPDAGASALGRFGISIGAAAPDPCAKLAPGTAP